MKPITLLILSSLISYSVFPQLPVRSKGTVTSLDPEWLLVKPECIRKNAVHQDSVYYFKSKESVPDSALFMIQYFDSVGNLTEMDEFNIKAKGEIARVTRLSYLDDELLQKEITAKTIDLFSKVSRYQKERYLYEYDSAGHEVAEKIYVYFGDSLNKYKITVYENLYDSTGHIFETYKKTGNSDRFLERKYSYNSGILDEVNRYDSNNEVTGTSVYRIDTKKKVKRIYQTDVSPDNLTTEFFYDEKNRVKQQAIYFEGVNLITQSYWYVGDLIDKQVVKSESNGAKYFYKHYYSKQ